MKARLAGVLLLLSSMLSPFTAQAAPGPAQENTPEMKAAREAYLECSTQALRERPARIRDARRAAAIAVDSCHTEKLALIGQYAIARPGVRDTEKVAEQVRRQAIDELAEWIVSMEEIYVDRGR